MISAAHATRCSARFKLADVAEVFYEFFAAHFAQIFFFRLFRGTFRARADCLCLCGVLEPPCGGGGGRGGLHMRAWRSRQARPRRRAASAATDAGAAGAVCALMTSESAGKSLLRLARVSQRASMRAQRGHSKRLHHRSKPRPRKERHALMIEPVYARSLPSASCPKRGRLHPRAQPTEEQVQGRKQGKRKEKRSSRKEKRSSRHGKRKEKRSSRKEKRSSKQGKRKEKRSSRKEKRSSRHDKHLRSCAGRKEKRSSRHDKHLSTFATLSGMKKQSNFKQSFFSLFSFHSQPIAPWRRRHEKKKQSRKKKCGRPRRSRRGRRGRKGSGLDSTRARFI